MAYITCKITPESGSEFEVLNITGIDWGVVREPAPDNRVGRNGHDIEAITISRNKSLAARGNSRLDNDPIRLVAKTGASAACKGWITVARAADENDVVLKLAWDEGHISLLHQTIKDESYVETFTISAPSIKADDFEIVQATGR